MSKKNYKTVKEITQELEEVLSDPELFKTHIKNVKELFEKFDKSKRNAARMVAFRVLKIRGKNIKKKHEGIIGQLLKKYRSELLGQKNVFKHQNCDDNRETVDQHNVSYFYFTGLILKISAILCKLLP